MVFWVTLLQRHITLALYLLGKKDCYQKTYWLKKFGVIKIFNDYLATHFDRIILVNFDSCHLPGSTLAFLVPKLLDTARGRGGKHLLVLGHDGHSSAMEGVVGVKFGPNLHYI